MGFDYGWTCPEIDRAIAGAKEAIRDGIEQAVAECCPMLEGNQLDTFVQGWADHVYSEVEDGFETARSSNEDMRKEAERQIEALEEEVNDLKAEVEQLEAEVDELKAEVEQMESAT